MPSAALFAIVWSLCASLDLSATLYLWVGPDLVGLVLGLAVLVAAGATLHRRTPARLTALAALWAAHVLYHFPLVPNHNVALAGANLTIAVASFRRATLDAAYARFAGVVRLHLLVLYALAALHKLNWDYLDPTVSCAPALARGIAGKLHLPYGGPADLLAIAGSLGLEIAIPVLLAFRPTRVLGIAIGLVFHLVLSFDSVVPILGFSATVYSLYVLFLPEGMAAAILGRRVPALPLVAAAAALALVCGAGGDGAGHMFLLPPPPLAIPPAVAAAGAIVLRGGWHVLAGFALIAFAGAWGARAATRAPRPALALLVFPLLVVADGLAPYLGVKTVPCFSMFSNLVTAEGESNHIFMPARRAPEDDLVEIVDSSSPRLRAVAAARVRVTAFELRRLLSGEGRAVSTFLIGGTDEVAAADFWLVYRRAGRTVRLARAESPDDTLFQPHPWIASKLVAYRLLPAHSRPAACLW